MRWEEQRRKVAEKEKRVFQRNTESIRILYDDNYTRFDIMNYLACSNICAFTQISPTTVDNHHVTLLYTRDRNISCKLHFLNTTALLKQKKNIYKKVK